MAITILPGGSRASSLGRAMGTGLGQGLQLLMQDKINSMLRAKELKDTTAGLEALKIPRDTARNIARLPKELQVQVVKNFYAGAEANALEDVLNQMGGAGGNAPAQQQQAIPNEQQQALLGQQQAMQDNSDFSAWPRQQQAQQGVQQVMQGLQQAQPQPTMVSGESKLQDILSKPRLNPRNALKVATLKQAEAIANRRIASREMIADKRLAAQEKKADTLEKREIDQSNRPILDEINKGSRASLEDDRRIDRMEKLINKGNLTRPRFHSFLKTLSNGIFGFGIDLHSLESADAQEFNKLTVEFLKGAKDIFGARITNFEAATFLKMIPNLSQTREGKLRVTRNMKIYNKAKRTRKKAMDEIISENNGRTPRNFDTLIDKRAGKELDMLAKEFASGLRSIEVADETKKTVGRGEALERIMGRIDNPIPEALDIFFGKG